MNKALLLAPGGTFVYKKVQCFAYYQLLQIENEVSYFFHISRLENNLRVSFKIVITIFLILRFKVRIYDFFVASQYRVAPYGKEIRQSLENIVSIP